MIYLFGGVSQEIDLTGKELTYFIYNIGKNEWSFKIDQSIKSPFNNSRFTKPTVDIIEDDLFVSYHNEGTYQYLEFFELTRGGIHLKYKHINDSDLLNKNKSHGLNAFTDIVSKEYHKIL